MIEQSCSRCARATRQRRNGPAETISRVRSAPRPVPRGVRCAELGRSVRTQVVRPAAATPRRERARQHAAQIRVSYAAIPGIVAYFLRPRYRYCFNRKLNSHRVWSGNRYVDENISQTHIFRKHNPPRARCSWFHTRVPCGSPSCPAMRAGTATTAGEPPSEARRTAEARKDALIQSVCRMVRRRDGPDDAANLRFIIFRDKHLGNS